MLKLELELESKAMLEALLTQVDVAVSDGKFKESWCFESRKGGMQPLLESIKCS